jgi:hypothetical protein
MTCSRSAQHVRVGALLGCVAFLFCGFASAQNQSMDCSAVPSKTHATLAASDENGPNHLKLTRKLEIEVPVDLEVCDADLTIKGGKDEFVRITVDVDNNSAGVLLGDYFQTLDLTAQSATVKLHLPKHPRAKVIIEVPSGVPTLKLNLVRGDLTFETERVRGELMINVVFGHVDMLANADAYQTLNMNILLGSLHDHRPDGEQAFGMVSKSLAGTGRGSINLNVVKGTVDVHAWD